MTENRDSTDVLLWLAGAVFTGVAITWLVVSKPWAQNDEGPEALATGPANLVTDEPAATPEQDAQLAGEVDAETMAGGTKQASISEPEATLGSPLRMAELAVRAGMLLEPEGYSAWSLYQQALSSEPRSAAAKQGLRDVADLLMNRAGVAIEQSRTADATRLVETVRAVLPEHPQATRLAAELELGEAKSSAPPAPAQLAAAAPAPEPKTRQTRPRAKLEKPKIKPTASVVKTAPARKSSAPSRDLFGEAAEAFQAAFAAGKLLAPEESSARHYLLEMVERKPEDERTITARNGLTQALMERAAEAIDALDTVAADVWLTQAEELGTDQLLTESARLEMDQKIIARDAARPIPVSQLSVLNYVPPRYPSRAVERDIEGWVELEFTVGKDGQPQDINVLDASHERYFRKEAVDAVSQWAFEPHVVRGATVAQRTSARITFKLQ